VTGCEGRWRVRYADLPGRLTADGRLSGDREIHVPEHQPVVLVLKSADYVYTFALPAYDLKEIAVPDLEFTMRLCPSDAGRFEFHGNELCGEPHSGLDGHLCVESQDRFFEWYGKMSAKAAN
jgi:heme/copper-type cytochrome/quinol oxidase subunit 2